MWKRGGGIKVTLSLMSLPQRARASCDAALRALSSVIPASVDMNEVVRFADALDADEVRRIGASLANDSNATKVGANFRSIDQEAALICLMHALDFGGGWRQELHAYGGKGAWATVKPGIERLFEESPNLESDFLAALTDADVGCLWRIEGERARPLSPFTSALRTVCNEVGAVLNARGHRTVEAFLADCLLRHQAADDPASKLVAELVDAMRRGSRLQVPG